MGSFASIPPWLATSLFMCYSPFYFPKHFIHGSLFVFDNYSIWSSWGFLWNLSFMNLVIFIVHSYLANNNLERRAQLASSDINTFVGAGFIVGVLLPSPSSARGDSCLQGNFSIRVCLQFIFNVFSFFFSFFFFLWKYKAFQDFPYTPESQQCRKKYRNLQRGCPSEYLVCHTATIWYILGRWTPSER